MTPLGPSLIAILASLSHAQTFDAHGMPVPPEGAGLRDPTTGLGGARTAVPAFSTTFEVNSGLLVERLIQGPVIEDTKIVDDLVGNTLGFQTGVYKGIGFGASMPLWFFSDGVEGGGPAAGDLSLWVPVEVVGAEDYRVGFSPMVAFPTGAAARYLGEDGVYGGGLLTGFGALGPVFASADLGLDATPRTNLPEWPGGVHFRYTVDAGVQPVDVAAFHLELRGRSPFASAAPSLPMEALVTAKIAATERFLVTATAGRGVMRGVGTGGFRLYTGLTWVPGKGEVVEQEIVREPPPKEFHIIDDRNFPILGATITAAEASAVTDLEGYAGLPPRSLKDGTVKVEHPHYETIELPVNADSAFYEAQLVRKPVSVAASVVGPQGSLMAVEVEVDGPYDPGPPRIDEAGVRFWDLKEGTWYVRMSSPGLGSQERTIVIESGRTEPIRVDAVLMPAVSTNDNIVRVQVVDRLGRPVEDAVVALENRDLGTTGTGGDLAVMGLTSGAGALTIRSERFGEGARVNLIIPETGEQVVQAVVDWRPGSVQVQAVNPRGQPVDATVNFIGPANLPSRSMGSDGSELFVVRPGTWNVEISAPGLGTQLRTIEVTEEAGELVVVDVNLVGDEQGTSDLTVQINDVDGQPVPNVNLSLDGKPIGATGPGGDITLSDLKPGRRELVASGELVLGGSTAVELLDGGHQIAQMSMKWVDGVVLITAVDAVSTYPIDALIEPMGGTAVAPVPLGIDGAEQIRLAPGPWVFKASAPGKATQERPVTVQQGSGRRLRVGFRLADEGAAEGTEISFRPVETVQLEVPTELGVVVKGPDGTPVEATVTLHTATGAVPAGSLVAVAGETTIVAPPGKGQLLIEAPGMRTQVVDVELIDGKPTEVEVAMTRRDPAEGATVLIKAETERGDALVGAEVKVGGMVVGTTGLTGTWELVSVPENMEVTITPAQGDAYVPVTMPLAVSTKAQRAGEEVRATVVLPDAAQTVQVTVLDPYGNAVPAQVLAVQGDNEAAAANLDGAAKGELVLAPGSYTITAMTEDGSLATTELVVPSLDPRAGEDVAYTFIPGADPSGTSADGAATLLDAAGRPTLALRVEQVSAAISDGALVPVNPILFDSGSHVLRQDAMPLVADLARWLNAHREAALIEVGGHTDDVGGVEYNQQLSERRAESVMAALIQYGVALERLQARGYGLSRPVTANVDAESRQRNRRVALVVQDWQD